MTGHRLNLDRSALTTINGLDQLIIGQFTTFKFVRKLFKNYYIVTNVIQFVTNLNSVILLKCDDLPCHPGDAYTSELRSISF